MLISLRNRTQITAGVYFMTAHIAYISANKTKIVWMESTHSCLGAHFSAMQLPQSYWYSKLSEDAGSVGEQLRRHKEWPISGVTNSGRVWRKVTERDTRTVCQSDSQCYMLHLTSIWVVKTVLKRKGATVTVPETYCKSHSECKFQLMQLAKPMHF